MTKFKDLKCGDAFEIGAGNRTPSVLESETFIKVTDSDAFRIRGYNHCVIFMDGNQRVLLRGRVGIVADGVTYGY